MATGLASSLADDLLDAIGNAANVTALTAFYVKLHTGDPGASGTANAAGETTRKSVSFGAASGGAMSNDAQVQWTSYSTAETVTHVSFWDHATAGVFAGSDALNTSRTMEVGDTLTIAVGEIDITFTVAS